MTQVDLATGDSVRGVLVSVVLAIVLFWAPLAMLLAHFVRHFP